MPVGVGPDVTRDGPPCLDAEIVRPRGRASATAYTKSDRVKRRGERSWQFAESRAARDQDAGPRADGVRSIAHLEDTAGSRPWTRRTTGQ